jgi:uroporphyrinogen-III decarboxylase
MKKPDTQIRAEKQRVIDIARRQIEQLPVGQMRQAGMMQRLFELARKHGVRLK